MLKRLDGFDSYATANLPASHLWSVASGVTIVANAGRSGFTGDNAAFFDASLGSVLSTPITPTAVTGIYTGTYGLALRFLTLTSVATVAALETAISAFALVVSADGSVKVTQTTGGVLLGTVCETLPNVVPIATGGVYLASRLVQRAGDVTAVQIMASDQFGEMNLLAEGALLAQAAGDLPYTTFRLGGGVGETGATWYVDDVYLTDGVKAPTPVSFDNQVVWNDSYLGNMHVHTVYATADGYQLSVGNTPWVPSPGPSAYAMIDEHPPDEGATLLQATAADQLTTCVFNANRSEPFGLRGCCAFAPMFGLQWLGRLSATTLDVDVVPVVRLLVTGTLASDVVAEGDAITVSGATYTYYPQIFDRNPTIGDRPWTFAVVSAVAAGIIGSTEFGIKRS